jgi:hypothetical protein
MNSLIELNIIQGGGDFFFKKPEESNQETYGQIKEANIIAKNWKKKEKKMASILKGEAQRTRERETR